VGPFAKEDTEIYGDYAPDVSRQFTTTVAEGLAKLSGTVAAASGCSGVKCGIYLADEVTKAVDGADLVFVALGTGPTVESESNDRASLDLPGRQFEVLLDAVRVGKQPFKWSGKLDIVVHSSSIIVSNVTEII